MQEKYGFVYLWYDRKHKRFYIGSHWGSVDDGYICSSTWMKNSYKRRPTDFKRRILTKTNDRKTLLELENSILNKIKDEELGKRYYNLINKIRGHWTADDEKRLSVGQKISKSNIGISRNKGHVLSEEHKLKLLEANLGRKQSEESKKKKSDKLKGRAFSEEHRKKLSESRKRVAEMKRINRT